MLVSRGGDFQSRSAIAHIYYRDLYDIGCTVAYRIVAISRRYGTLKHVRFPLLLLSNNKTSASLKSAYVVGPTELETCSPTEQNYLADYPHRAAASSRNND